MRKPFSDWIEDFVWDVRRNQKERIFLGGVKNGFLIDIHLKNPTTYKYSDDYFSLFCVLKVL